MCSTPETVRAKSITGEFNGPNNVPPGLLTDAFINTIIATVRRNRQQLIVDFGCVKSGSNIVPDLIDYEVAHWIKLQMIMEGAPGQKPDPNVPPKVGPISDSEIDRAGTKSRLTFAITDLGPDDILGEKGYLQTFYGQRWYDLWISLPPEYTTASSTGVAPLPIAIFKLGLQS